MTTAVTFLAMTSLLLVLALSSQCQTFLDATDWSDGQNLIAFECYDQQQKRVLPKRFCTDKARPNGYRTLRIRQTWYDNYVRYCRAKPRTVFRDGFEDGTLGGWSD